MKVLMVISYLFAIVVANLLVTKFGAAALPVTAVLIIPFDLIARDQLHELWSGGWLKLKMFSLIVAGSALSYVLNVDSKMIALASCLSFLIAGMADFAVYSAFKNKSRPEKMIYSNLVSGTLDSIFFQLIAFGAISWSIAIEQTVFKAVGTILWTTLFITFLKVRSK